MTWYSFLWPYDHHMQCCHKCLQEKWKESVNQITTQEQDQQQQDQDQAEDEREDTEQNPTIYDFIGTLL